MGKGNSYIAFALGLAMAIINLSCFSSTLNIIYVLFVVLALGLAYAAQRFISTKNQHLFYGALSLCGSTFIYWWYPNIFVDDTGFVIRYMNMAREGCFYCYNSADGPVFGMSSFIYGIVVSGLAMFGIGSNELIINSVNFIGLTGLFYALLNSFYLLTKNHFYTLASVFLIVMSATQFQFAATAGLETNFHLAFVFISVYFFYSNQRKLMWLFFALSVISKLDTVPLIVVLSLIHLWENKSDYFGTGWFNSWRTGFLFAGLPILGFISLTFLMFDGPLPQSAFSKLYHHSHPSNHWFPFLELMLEKDNRAVLIAFALALPVIQLVMSLINHRFKLRDFALLIGFAGTMALFYFYNPVERMSWYYAMPELLLYAQLLLSVVWLSVEFAKNQKVALASFMLMFAALSINSVPLSSGEKVWTDKYMGIVEVERLEIGEFIANISGSDTLVSAHGHFGANYSGYVLDLSGLNSKLATDFELNADSILSTFRPQYFIQHANATNVAVAKENGYTVVKEWSRIEEYGYPKWVLWTRNDAEL